MKNKLPCYFIPVCMCLCPLLLSGCAKFYRYEEIPIKVIDPELNQPVEGATVSAGYAGRPVGGTVLFVPKNSPKGATTKTDASGLAKLKVVTNPGRFLRGSSIWADGYIPTNLDVGIRKIDNEDELIIPLYQKPEPKIEIVIPDDYLGPVAVQLVQSNELVMGESGQRLFTYRLQQDGQIELPITPLFSFNQLINDIRIHRIFSTDSDDCRFIVKHENGSNIIRVGREYEQVIQPGGPEQKVEPDRLAFRWVWDEGPRFLFVIGTEHDRDVLYKKLYPENRIGLDHDAFNAYFQDQEN